MAVNRFRQITPTPSQFISQPYVPNFDLLAKALQSQQQAFNQVQRVGEVPINALAGADEEYAETLRESLYDDIDKVSNLYAKEGISAGRRAARDLIQSTKRRVLPGGDIYELAQRKKQFTDFYSTQQERLEKGEITPEQFWASTTRAKEQYDAVGGYGSNANLSLSSRTQAVDPDEFLNEFLKNKESDLISSGYQRFRDPTTGKVVLRKSETEFVKYEDLLSEARQALANKMSTTGQLQDRFAYMNREGLSVDPLVEKYNTELSRSNTIKSNLNNLKGKELQEYLNTLGANLKVDGKVGKNTQAAKDAALEQVNQNIDEYNSRLNSISNLSEDELQNVLFNRQTEEYLTSLVDPYAKAASFTKQKDFQQLYSDPLLKFEFDKALKKMDNYELRIQGNTVAFNPQTRFSSAKDLANSSKSVTQKIQDLNSQLATTTDPQARKFIQDQIKWNEGKLSHLQSIQEQANEAVGNKFTQEEQQFIDKYTQSFNVDNLSELGQGDTYKEALQRRIKNFTGEEVSGTEAEKLFRKFRSLRNKKEKSIDSWLEENNDNFTVQQSTISLDSDQSEAISNLIDTQSWTFFDENGPIDNTEQTKLFGTEDKPIIGNNIEVQSISQTPFGDYGHMVQLVDKNTGKVYQGTMNNSNLAQVLGKDIFEKAAPNSDQQLIAYSMMNPQLSQVTGQLTNLSYGDSRNIIVSGENLGSINKKQTAAGVMFEYTVPEGFEDEGEIIPYNDPLKLANDLYKAQLQKTQQ